MKSLLVMLLVSICVIGYRSPEIMQAIGLAGAAQDPSAVSIESLAAPAGETAARPMSPAEFAELSKTDPKAYQKFIASRRVQEERREVDKLLNFFSRGKFE